MSEHEVRTREEWLAARTALLGEEKELTRRSDELARKRQALPWVPVEKGYRFETEDGTKALPDLFDGRSQLLVYHFMFGPTVEGWPDAGCPGCSYTADSLDGAAVHLPPRGVTFVAVSRAPLANLQAYRRRMGWSFPWVSAAGSDFNLDFAVFTEEGRKTGTGFNFGTPKHAAGVVGAEHEVVDEKLRAPVEEVGQRLRPVVGLEAVVLLHCNPWQRLPFPGEVVAPAGELLLLCQERGPGGQPLLARPDLVLRHSGLLPLTTSRPAAGRKLIAAVRRRARPVIIQVAVAIMTQSCLASNTRQAGPRLEPRVRELAGRLSGRPQP
jgi:predicted dithiol-disulfide oxidoreductase (DUF899 family)